jgi:hypothetical protein
VVTSARVPTREGVEAGRSWVLVFTGSRPLTVNGERKLHPMQRAAVVREWRDAFRVLALEQRVPRLDAVRVREIVFTGPVVGDVDGLCVMVEELVGVGGV